ncbi:MAG: type I-E CRISPR-associated protein Cse1/CasA [Oceanospirillaceae bacterium]|nr:type I-E CRISPR-associated protein Cse1/CasA [Oceanospirillaceae bacterium]
MDLLQTEWIPVIREDGFRTRIAPWQIAEMDNPVVELDAPRADFQGALYQFLIGLLQTCCPPAEPDDWIDWYEQPPAPAEIQKQFSSVSDAFQLFTSVGSSAFMQDLELENGEEKPISGLLIEAPGGKTLRDNLDFFVKRGLADVLCPSCAAQALFTLQINAPGGGVGHRVGLRGGGPLTTLVVPSGPEQTLWHKLWLNVLDRDHTSWGAAVKPLSAEIFPWMAPTRVSDKRGVDTLPDDTHPLQMYWSMPRRIRLHRSDESCCCDICGSQSDSAVNGYETRNYGVNYDGPWVHPLTPYRFDPKNEKLPLSLKGQKGGLGYRHWLGLALRDVDSGDKAAQVINHYVDQKARFLDESYTPQIWCFGYDMDNMKARGWIDHRLPLFALSTEQADRLKETIEQLILCARAVLPELRKQVKSAWFRRPEDHKGDTSVIDQTFWHETESTFYQLLSQLAALPKEAVVPAEHYARWYNLMIRSARELFDYFTLRTAPEGLDLKRVMRAREQLLKRVYTLKPIKQLKGLADPALKEAVHG